VICVTGEFRLPLESLAAAREAMARVIAASRAEPGCLAYAYAEDVLESGLFRVTESWDSREALAAHFEQPHMKRWQQDRAALGMTGRVVTAHRVVESEAL